MILLKKNSFFTSSFTIVFVLYIKYVCLALDELGAAQR